MSTVEVRRRHPHHYDVTVRGDGPATSHRVSVPGHLLEAWGMGEDDEESVVRESFAFLLEREPASSIMGEFSLSVIGRYFPEYGEELPRRLSAR